MSSKTQVPSKRSLGNSTAHLFNKQRQRLNPTFTHHFSTDNTTMHGMEDAVTHDSVAASFDDDFVPFASLPNDNFTPFEQSFDSEESFVNTALPDSSETPVESDYSCFTTSQQCITSLIYLLDAMECPDYAFKAIMEWARKCCDAGFDFNPKSKTRLGNLKWMYDALHNAEQMLPHLEPIDLPDPLSNIKSMNVICYDFVPQLLSIL
jgi:hypothetical protein